MLYQRDVKISDRESFQSMLEEVDRVHSQIVEEYVLRREEKETSNEDRVAQ